MKPHRRNKRYLRTKADKMGHLLELVGLPAKKKKRKK
jgi:hypothetical protein